MNKFTYKMISVMNLIFYYFLLVPKGDKSSDVASSINSTALTLILYKFSRRICMLTLMAWAVVNLATLGTNRYFSRTGVPKYFRRAIELAFSPLISIAPDL